HHVTRLSAARRRAGNAARKLVAACSSTASESGHRCTTRLHRIYCIGFESRCIGCIGIGSPELRHRNPAHEMKNPAALLPRGLVTSWLLPASAYQRPPPPPGPRGPRPPPPP